MHLLRSSSVTILAQFLSHITEVNKFGYILFKMSPGLKLLKVTIPCNNAFAWNYLKNWWLASLWCIWLDQAQCIYSLGFGSIARAIFPTENRVCSSFHEPVVNHLNFSSGCYMETNLLWWQRILTTSQRQISQVNINCNHIFVCYIVHRQYIKE